MTTRVSPGASSPVAVSLAELIAIGDRLLPSRLEAGRRLGAKQGGYLSRFRGRGMEFAEVRAYLPGDDARNIDWRVTARRGKVHTKLFHEERERPVLVALDYRRPMFFATRGRFKAVRATQLAALFAWQALARGDRIGGFLFSEERNLELRPQLGKKAVLQLLRQMVADPAWERPRHQPFEPKQRLAVTLQRLRRVARPGSLIRLLSDFSQWDERVELQLAQLNRHCELELVHCFDPLEADLPPAGSYRLSDGLRDLSIVTTDRDARWAYQQHFAQRRQLLEDFCRRQHARFMVLPSDLDPIENLSSVRAGG
ncbi:DUF58 domain-containing protein [Geothermobacter hydrogeniphilus]|uniref:DUF58 domain-containing protein n=1 Tax=Geothermobacter hydrogeniphilus TaxID=1969733 RepID=A0A2K2H9I2_9BACT|nr:DUF58 domain-containing protein [Geothermobacter hydrogeniphilus]PNU19921.1 DUF58 domain-containing protein [Geothermobacter hydrogeniphilus]